MTHLCVTEPRKIAPNHFSHPQGVLPQEIFVMKFASTCAALMTCLLLQGCAVVAVADVVASTVIYTGKTVINVLDAVTPDIVNKKKKD